MMGKKRTMSVKKIVERLITNNPNGFTVDFEANKGLVNEVTNFPSKIIRNKVTGQVTRRMRKGSQISVQYGNPSPYHKRKRSRIRR